MRQTNSDGMLTGVMYAGVHRSEDGYEWMASPQCLPEQVREEYARLQKTIPSWACANPLVRVVRVQVTELSE